MLIHFTSKAFLVSRKFHGIYSGCLHAVAVFNIEPRAAVRIPKVIAFKNKYIKDQKCQESDLVITEIEVNPDSIIHGSEIWSFAE